MELFKNKKEETTEQAENVVETIKTNAVTFLMFSEYMGYVSDFIDDLDKWIDGTAPKPYIQNFLMVEAKVILQQMKKDYTIEEMHQWWNEYYPIILCKADAVLDKMKKLPATVNV